MSRSKPPEPDGPGREGFRAEGPKDHPSSPPACPHCGSTDVELEAPFGSTLMTRQFYCRGCRTVFEWVKWEEEAPGDWLRE